IHRCATASMFVVIYGMACCFLSMGSSYYSGTISTMEKRFSIPNKVTGIIGVGSEISTVLCSASLSYYASRGHRPRWIALGFLIIILFCILMLTSHFFYGPGEEALRLTEEYGSSEFVNTILNSTQKDDSLCHKKDSNCIEDTSDYKPIILFFIAQFIGGIGCSFIYAPGLSYMDDNLSKANSPRMLSFSTFLRMLGPAMGFSMASFCLRLYIDPFKKPLITPEDPRWMGAWWLGWFPMIFILLIAAFFVGIFPKETPKARVRRLKAADKGEMDAAIGDPSFQDMFDSLKRLASNKVYVYYALGSIFYCYSYMPYWSFTSKYMEIQFRQSASTSTLAMGTWPFGFSAAGVLIAGFVISKYKPSARTMAAWNFVLDYIRVAALICYALVGCDEGDRANLLTIIPSGDSCSASCDCEFVYYAPVCSSENVTYISACHAGCTEKGLDELGRTIYTGCKCLGSFLNQTLISNETSLVSQSPSVVDGACPVNCDQQFLIFLAVMYLLRFVSATGSSSNQLLALRCVSTKDKTFSMGFSTMMLTVLVYIPGPIISGWMWDSYCLVWGKTCGVEGNCWIYDSRSLRFTINLVSAFLIFLASFFNFGIWYYAKDVKIFDEEETSATRCQDEVLDLKDKPNPTNADKQ
ncbi:hypothetical protein KR059_012315, partial [Drosophila kikkawai]